MKKAIKVVCIAALALVFTTGAFAGGFNLAGVGGKALAMSGSFRAIADDWSAMYWNPAGLAGQGSGAWLEMKLLYPMAWVTPSDVSGNATYPGYDLYRPGVEQSSLAQAYPDGAAAFQWQFNDRLTAGISVFAPSALGAEWENLYLGPPAGYRETEEYPSRDWYSSMMVIDIHPTVGYKINDMFSVGLGLAIKYATIEMQTPKLSPAYNPASGDRLPFPNQNFFIDALLEGSGMGFGFNVGVLAHLTEKLHMGLSYTGPTTINLEGSVDQVVYLSTLAGGGTLDAKPDASADFPLPMDFGFGVAYDISERLTVAADVCWTKWDDLDEVTIELEGSDPTGAPAEDTELILHWENTLRYNVGLNWIAMPERGLELRCGFYFDPSPIPDETMRPTITDVADKSNISIGFAYPFGENFLFEGYWEHVVSGEKTVAANEGEMFIDNVPGDWNMQVDTFGIQLGYLF